MRDFLVFCDQGRHLSELKFQTLEGMPALDDSAKFEMRALEVDGILFAKDFLKCMKNHSLAVQQ